MTKQQHWEYTETPANQESEHTEKENPSSSSSSSNNKSTTTAKRKKPQQQQIRLDNCIVPMQCTGCFTRGKRAAIIRRYPVVVFSCVQRFRVSIIHRTLTWTTGYLTCVRSYACVYTGGWGTPTSQHNILTRKKLSHLFLMLRTGLEPLVMESIWSRGRRAN